MTDIVERLRNNPRHVEACHCRKLTCEAADEIDRLQTANDYAFGPSGQLAKLRAEIERLHCVKPLAEWHEDMGPMLWWKFPIDEAPYAGGPNDSDWPGYHTHWTVIPIPGHKKAGRAMKPDRPSREAPGRKHGA